MNKCLKHRCGGHRNSSMFWTIEKSMQSLPWSLHSVRSGQCFNWMHDGKNRKWWKLPRGATVSQERAEDPSYTEGWSIHKILFNLCSARITHHKCACGGFRYRPGLKLLFQRLIHPHLVGTTRQAHICPSDEPEGRAVDCSTLQSPIFLFWWSQLSDVRCVCVCVGVCVRAWMDVRVKGSISTANGKDDGRTENQCPL